VSSSSRRRTLILMMFLLALAVGGGALLAQQQPAPRPAQDEFLPIDQLPPGETLPAARLLIAAYAVVWIGVAAYLWSIWQRLGRVEREIADVTRRVQDAQAAQRPRPAGGAGR
jgi:CcmD family protein